MAQLTPKSVVTSASGMELPIIGLGTSQQNLANLATTLPVAFEAGYHLLDTASIYDNEKDIGNVLCQLVASGKLRREDVFITTKLPFYGNPKNVKESLEKQLKALQVEYVDLYLIHHPVTIMGSDVVRRSDGLIDTSRFVVDLTTDHVALWKEMEKQVDAGLTKAIGLSNFNIKQIERVLKNARIPPANLQIEMHLYNQGKAEQEFCKSKGITLTSFATLGSPWKVNNSSLSPYNLSPMEDPVVVRIAEAHGKTPAQVLLRHMLQLGVAVIPKSVSSERILQNIQVFDFALTEVDIMELNSLDRKEEGRLFSYNFAKAHPEYPYLT